jgi:DNA-binding transcriptional ArsR family regulator
VHAFEVVGDPVRRRILELLAADELSAGDIVRALQAERSISQPAVSQHLRILREHGFVTAQPIGARRVYAVHGEGLREVNAWLERFRHFWTSPLEALATEVARGKRQRRAQSLRAQPISRRRIS